jgi:hypothetical protein
MVPVRIDPDRDHALMTLDADTSATKAWKASRERAARRARAPKAVRSMETTNDNERRSLSPRAQKLASQLVTLGMAWFAIEGLFAWGGARSWRIVGLWFLASLSLAVLRLRGSPEKRLIFGLFVVPLIVAMHGLELRMIIRRPPPATAASLAGRPWDGRSIAEVVHDTPGALPVVQPKSVILMERGALHTPSGELVPLGGVSGVRSVFCNEGGAWTSYDADERGFVNPRGVVSGAPIEIALVGDSFTQGACVKAEESYAGVIRAEHPALVNLGMGGNGPLLELGSVREYLARLRPKRVLWFYFRNDFDDLNIEKGVPLLLRYLDPGFRQGLFDRQPEIDGALRALVAKHTQLSKRWPRHVDAMGLTRARAPVVLQDLIMGEHNSATAALLRLDTITSAFEVKAASAAPDFELFKKVLRRAKADVAAWGGELTFVYLPDMWFTGNKVKHHPLRDRVLEAVREVDLPLLDVDVPWSQERDLESLRYHPDAHDNPKGYAVIGRIVNAHLAR